VRGDQARVATYFAQNSGFATLRRPPGKFWNAVEMFKRLSASKARSVPEDAPHRVCPSPMGVPRVNRGRAWIAAIMNCARSPNSGMRYVRKTFACRAAGNSKISKTIYFRQLPSKPCSAPTWVSLDCSSQRIFFRKVGLFSALFCLF
jgi:hypothetical protein